MTYSYKGMDLAIDDALASEYEAAMGAPLDDLDVEVYLHATYVWKCEEDPFGYAASLPAEEVSAAVEAMMRMDIRTHT